METFEGKICSDALKGKTKASSVSWDWLWWGPLSDNDFVPSKAVSKQRHVRAWIWCVPHSLML